MSGFPWQGSKLPSLLPKATEMMRLWQRCLPFALGCQMKQLHARWPFFFLPHSFLLCDTLNKSRAALRSFLLWMLNMVHKSWISVQIAREESWLTIWSAILHQASHNRGETSWGSLLEQRARSCYFVQRGVVVLWVKTISYGWLLCNMLAHNSDH